MILQGDALEMLRTLPSEHIHCCVTSPPYWRLRDYHIDGQIGLEETPEEYIDKLVGVFAELKRVLRTDGTLWLNIGDSYAASGMGEGSGKQLTNRGTRTGGHMNKPRKAPAGLKPKDLCMIPAQLAIALRDDGWFLRSEIVWSKPNCMPESVTDRPTKTHEMIYLLTKSERYFYDAEAVKEQAKYQVSEDRAPSGNYSVGSGRNDGGLHRSGGFVTGKYRNLRSVWTIPTRACNEAHFAAFPPRLVEICIKAGCPDRCCPKCGSGWRRITEKTGGRDWRNDRMKLKGIVEEIAGEGANKRGQSMEPLNNTQQVKTIGFRPSCNCGVSDSVPGIVLDTFAGAGTVALVAESLNRNWICIELNPEYVEIIKRRPSGPLFAGIVE